MQIESRAEIRQVAIGTAGHIDHGKTALVRALTGVDTDRLPAEKARGISIDLGFAALEVGSLALSFIDVPGHERFVRNMLAGATGIDMALLVVAADDSVMPQTLEHLSILRLLGLRSAVVAITKVDLVDDDWANLVEDEVRRTLSEMGFESMPIVRTSAPTGRGIEALRAALVDSANQLAPPHDPGWFRMAVDRTFTLEGRGTVVTGTVASGIASVGDELELFPGRRSVRIRAVHRFGKAVESVGRGTRAAINLVGVHHAEVARGATLATPGVLSDSRRLSVWLEPAPGAITPIRHRGRYVLHLGTARVAAEIRLLQSRELGTVGGLAQILTGAPVVAQNGQPFVIRSQSPAATVAGGIVLDPCPKRVRRRDRTELDRLDRLRNDSDQIRLLAALSRPQADEGTDLTLSRDSAVSISPVRATIDRLLASGELVSISNRGRRLLPTSMVADLEARVLSALARLHSVAPRHSGIARERLDSALADLQSAALVDTLIDRLASQGRIRCSGRLVAASDFRPRLTQAESRLREKLASALLGSGFTPPDRSELLKLADARPAVVDDLLALLVDEGRIVSIGSGLYLDAEAEARLRQLVTDRLADGSCLTMSELRDLFGTTRKFAVPIGEYLDRIGLTEREGDQRRLRALPSSPIPPISES